MILAKLIATLATSMAPAAKRSAVISAWALRRRMSPTGALVLRRRGAHHLQHVVHRRLVLGGLVGYRSEQRLHLGEVIAGELVHGAAERGPLLLQLLVEVELPRLRPGLNRRAGIDDDLLQVRR